VIGRRRGIGTRLMGGFHVFVSEALVVVVSIGFALAIAAIVLALR